jgi:Fibronectin type III domain
MSRRAYDRKGVQLIIAFFTVGLSPVALQAQTVYVSTRGRDQAGGTNGSPVATIERAVTLARGTREHAVEIEAGTYVLTAPLHLTAADSGLSLKAATGQSVTLSGGVRVQGWKVVDRQHSLWSAAVPAAIKTPRQIYIGGVRASRAKGRVPVGLTETEQGYTADSDQLAHWKHPDEMEFVYTGGNALWSEPEAGLGGWTEPRCPVAAIHGTMIEMAQPCWDNSTKRIRTPGAPRPNNLVGPASIGKQPTFMENAYELLGTPGEFYFDRTSRTLFYTPRPGEDLRTADVEVPVLESLLEITGVETAPVHDITIAGVTFAYAGWQEPSGPQGFSEIQANYRVTGKDGATRQALCTLAPGGTCPYAAWTPEPANVSTRFADSIHFERDTFTHLGAAGLGMAAGAHNNLVQGCVFTDISGNGLELAGVDAPESADRAFAIGNRIENNLFRNVGAEFHGGIPIVVGYARFSHIAHNQIDHVPYAGISMGWGGWPDKISLPGVANRSTGNVVEKNRITRFMLNLADGGGIYTQGRTGETIADGERIEGNVIDLQFSTGHGIYTDNGSAMISIRSNVVFNTNHDNIASTHKDYYDGLKGDVNDPLAIEDNWWQQGDPDSDAKQIVRKGNHLINTLDEAPAELLSSAGLEPAFRDLTGPPARTVAPQPPTGVAVFVTPTEAYVTWRPSVFDGGAAVDHYIVRSEDGAEATLSQADFDRACYAVLKLKSTSKPVRYTVIAVNSAGASAASLPSLPVIPGTSPAALPGVPDYAAVELQGTRASIHFAAPKDSKDIIAYAVTIDPEGRHEVFTGRRMMTLGGTHRTFVTLDGLTPGKHYRFGIAAINASGQGETIWVDDKHSNSN